MIIDTHAHLNFDAYDDDRDEVIKRTLAGNIQCINVGTSFATSKSAVELAQKQEGFYAAIGLHPTDVDEELDLEAYKRLALSGSRRVVAIGEIGLDFFRKPFDAEKQKTIFLQQMALAKELDLPLIIHCRMAHDEMIELLQGQNMRGVVHCFTGTLEQAKKYLDLGFYLGINGIIFKFNIDEVIKEAPLDKLLLETDCPYLTPPMAETGDPAKPASLASGPKKRNEPVFMSYTIQKIAELKNITPDEVTVITTQNAKKLFNI